MQPFKLTSQKIDREPLEASYDLLQAWENEHWAALNQPHPVPSLLDLELIRQGTPTGLSFSIRGQAATIGRYSPETGPVDIDLDVLRDYERYQIGGPHVRLGLDSEGWWLESFSKEFPTTVNHQQVPANGCLLADRCLLSLGKVLFRVRTSRRLDRFQPNRVHGASFHLKREAASCDAIIPLVDSNLIIGRNSPWTPPVDIDLSDLPEHQRVHIARQHARVFQDEGQWFIEQISERCQLFVNRRLSEGKAIKLYNGDEVGLGNVLFSFQNIIGADMTMAGAVYG